MNKKQTNQQNETENKTIINWKNAINTLSSAGDFTDQI